MVLRERDVMGPAVASQSFLSQRCHRGGRRARQHEECVVLALINFGGVHWSPELKPHSAGSSGSLRCLDSQAFLVPCLDGSRTSTVLF